MAGPSAVAIVLSDRERAELERRMRRRKIAQADAMRAEIILLAAAGLNNCAIAEETGASRMTVMTWRKRFALMRLDGPDDEPCWGAPRKIGDDKITEVVTKTQRCRPMRPIGIPARWRRRLGCRFRPCIASGSHSRCSLIVVRPSSCRQIHNSLRRCATSSGSTLIRQSMHWCFASMKRAKFRHLIAPNLFCRCAPVKLSGEPTTMSATAQPLCSPRSTSR